MFIQRMFEPILSRIPRNRSEWVQDLEIPDISLEPYIWVPPEDVIEPADSDLCGSTSELRMRANSINTESDMPLSRALTDSEIDYYRYKRIQSRRLSDPFAQMREAINYFPTTYLDSLNSFQTLPSDIETSTLLDDFEERRIYNEELRRFNEQRRLYNEELRLKMDRFFDEDCLVYAPEDPAILELDEALRNLDMKRIELEMSRDLIV